MVANHQSGRDQGGIIEHANEARSGKANRRLRSYAIGFCGGRVI
jgi:hypothetical protein